MKSRILGIEIQRFKTVVLERAAKGQFSPPIRRSFALTIMNENPKKHFRGAFIPAAVWSIYKTERINAEEMMLLFEIEVLQDPKWGGCWASNRHLAEEWGKTRTWTCKTIRKLRRIGLLKIKRKNGKRIIVSLLQIQKPHVEGVSKKTPAYEQKDTGGVSKRTHPSKENKNKREEKNKPAPDGDRTLLPSFSFKTISREVLDFAKFTRDRNFHILSRNGRTLYKKGGGPGGWSKLKLNSWNETFEGLLSMEPRDKVQEVLKWYFKNYDAEGVPKFEEMPRFIKNFKWVEDTMRRDKIKRRRDGEFPEELTGKNQYERDILEWDAEQTKRNSGKNK